MLKSKTKKLAALCCAIALVLTCSISAFAANVGWSATLPNWRNGVVLKSGTCNNGGDYIEASVTKMGGDYDSMWMLAQKGGNAFSDTYYAYENQGAATIYLNQSVEPKTGLRLYGGNNRAVAVNVSARGTVNFN